MNSEATYTTVDELRAGKYGFEVPTFNYAFDKILNEAYAFRKEDKC